MNSRLEHFSIETLHRRRRNMRHVATAVLGTVLLSGLGGCATIGAKPWEHDLLAEPAMQLDAAPIRSQVDDHIYFSKEASSGGRGFAGGGCGCN
jgi:hypothetical protein